MQRLHLNFEVGLFTFYLIVDHKKRFSRCEAHLNDVLIETSLLQEQINVL